jgi:hypothetical protein
MEQIAKQSLFPLGQLVTAPGALAALRKAGQGPPEFLARHVSGERDRKQNQFSLERGNPLFSSYHTHAGDELWVITDRQFSTTTILSPEEF